MINLVIKTTAIILFVNLIISVNYCFGSVGDRLPQYRNCLEECVRLNCTTRYAIQSFNSRQPKYLQLLGWNCDEECKYQCQWFTVNHLINTGLPYHELPQFHGKWAFTRILGIQEPASVLFSLLNLVTNFYGYKCYRRHARNDPFGYVWTIHTILAINAWFWSTIFHIHETGIREKLDYFSAYSVVIFSVCALSIRIFDNQLKDKNRLLAHIAIAVPFFAFFLYHIHYLFYIHFDYGYNMKVNVVTGILSSFGWILWSLKNLNKGKHIWKCVISILLLNLMLLLELNDFPPIGYILDAHSLWHLGTVPLPLIWFSYLKDEAMYISKAQKQCDINVKKNNFYL